MRSEDERGERPLRRGAKRENRQRKMEGSQATRAMRAMRAMRASRGTDRESSLNKHPIYFFFLFHTNILGKSVNYVTFLERNTFIWRKESYMHVLACVCIVCVCLCCVLCA